MKLFFFILFLFISAGRLLLAQPIRVSSIAELQAAVQSAKPGDVIVLKNGKYVALQDIVIDKSGTQQKPITIEAESIGGAEISGNGGISLMGPASYLVIRGFKFTHAASRARTAPGTRFCRWTHNVFETPGKGEYLTIAGSDHQIDYNTFQNKNSMGRILAIRGEGNQIAQRLHIHHNYFYNFPDQGGANGAETLQFGLSGFSLSNSTSIVEYNLFEKCAGENELISVKASGVTLRYNTIRDCPAQFTLRHGNNNKVYGNYFFNTPGLRIFGDDHLIFSNYFEDCDPAITIGNGGGEVADGAALTEHDRPDKVLIGFNTLINNKKNIIQPARKNGLGANSISLVNNIIQGGAAAVAIAGPYTTPVWKGNIIFKTTEPGDLPSMGYQTKDPKLIKDKKGIYHLESSSPAIDEAVGDYSMISVDMDGQPRTGKLDIGADEVNEAVKKAHPLTSTDVGTAAK